MRPASSIVKDHYTFLTHRKPIQGESPNLKKSKLQVIQCKFEAMKEKLDSIEKDKVLISDIRRKRSHRWYL